MMFIISRGVRVIRFVNTKTVDVSSHYNMGGFAAYASAGLSVGHQPRDDAPPYPPPLCLTLAAEVIFGYSILAMERVAITFIVSRGVRLHFSVGKA